MWPLYAGKVDAAWFITGDLFIYEIDGKALKNFPDMNLVGDQSCEPEVKDFISYQLLILQSILLNF